MEIQFNMAAQTELLQLYKVINNTVNNLLQFSVPNTYHADSEKYLNRYVILYVPPK